MRPTHFLPSSLPPFLPSLFFAFRLLYIPAVIFSHTGHGLPYLNATLALCATFGMETLTRRSGQNGALAIRSRRVWFVVVALLLLGLFPEEAPTSVILWAAIGAAWGRLWPGVQMATKIGTQRPKNTRQICADFLSASITPFRAIRVLFSERWVGLLLGGLLGLTGLVGPGSWLMAGILALWAGRGAVDD